MADLGSATSLQERVVARQAVEPDTGTDGFLWIDTSGSNTEINILNADAGRWELMYARGPDQPDHPVDGSMWVSGSNTYTHNSGSWEGVAPSSITRTDAAETFAESDVTLSHTETAVSNESVHLRTDTATDSRPADSGWSNGSGSTFGLVINPNTSLHDLSATISSSTASGTPTDLTLERLSDSTVVASDSNGPYNSGETVSLSGLSLSSGTEYALYVTASDGGDIGTVAPTYPVTGTHVDMVTGYYNGNHTTNQRVYAVNDIQTVHRPSSGTCYVEWPYPTDIYQWDVGTFTQTLDGETVEIYVEADDGSGWTEVLGPIGRNADLSSVPSSSELRYRVEISRANTANNPSVDSIYRGWTV